jgi:hypothetical protein
MFVESMQAIDEAHDHHKENDENNATVLCSSSTSNKTAAAAGSSSSSSSSVVPFTPRNADVDYAFLQMFLERRSPFTGTEIENEINGPNMRIFYQNLARVVRGEWWFYPPSETLSLKEYDARLRRLPHANIEHEERVVFQDFMYFLAFDYVDYGKKSFAGCIVPDDYVFNMICYTNNRSVAKRNEQHLGLKMPAKRFVSLYKGGSLPGDLRGKKSAKRQWKGAVQVTFRKLFHK